MHESGQTCGNISQHVTGTRNEANTWAYRMFRLELPMADFLHIAETRRKMTSKVFNHPPRPVYKFTH